nr:hypothetical protein [Anaerolineae bacterium]
MMFQNDAEILFPARVIPFLRNLRGAEWQALIDRVLACSDDSIEKQAFTLMMIRLDGCLTCHSDSYRAMRGCTLCAQQTITRFKESDLELVAAFEQAYADIVKWQQTGTVPPNERISDSG